MKYQKFCFYKSRGFCQNGRILFFYYILLYPALTQTVYANCIFAQKLLLGHLQIGERIFSLSGGENIRIKLVSALKGKSEVYGIDEPFKGLDNSEIYVVAKALGELCEQGKTVNEKTCKK